MEHGIHEESPKGAKERSLESILSPLLGFCYTVSYYGSFTPGYILSGLQALWICREQFFSILEGYR